MIWRACREIFHLLDNFFFFAFATQRLEKGELEVCSSHFGCHFYRKRFTCFSVFIHFLSTFFPRTEVVRRRGVKNEQKLAQQQQPPRGKQNRWAFPIVPNDLIPVRSASPAQNLIKREFINSALRTGRCGSEARGKEMVLQNNHNMNKRTRGKVWVDNNKG